MRQESKRFVAALMMTSCLAAPSLLAAQTRAPTELEEIVVSGEITYRDRTETVAPELVYDQKFFEKFEPVSVGDQLKRVPGVAFTSDIGEYDAPQLRGLGQGFTQVLVNGRAIPGAGNDRSVFVDRIPAEIIDRIEIIRSPSADIDSQGVGGTINIILKSGESLPPGVIARGGVSYDVDRQKWSPTGALSVSGRNEAETILYSVTLDAQRRYNNKHTIEEVFEEDSVGFDREVTSGGDGRGLVKFFDPEKSVAVERVQEEDSRRSTDLSFNGDVTFKLSENTTLRVDGYYLSTRRDESQDTFVYEGDGSVGGIDFDDGEHESQEADFDQDNYGLAGLIEHKFNDLASFEGQVRFNALKDDSAETTFSEDDDHTPLDGTAIRARDNEWLADGAFKFSLPSLADSLGITSAGLKIGLAGKVKDRDYRLLTSDDLDDVGEEKISDGAFDYKEKRLDGFVVFEAQVTPDVKFEAGVRAEKTKIEQDFRTVFTNNEDAEVITDAGSAKSNEFQINPSAHLQWALTGSDQLRFSIARTVRRPSIDQLVPAVMRESPGDDDATIGNADLEFETSLGFDVGYERRLAGRGILGVNLFRRDISNLIGLVSTGTPADSVGAGSGLDGNLYTYQNLGDAKVWGVEFDLSTPLSFIGLDETGIFANYTRLWSERDDPITGEDVRVDYQPEYIYNVGVTHNVPDWGMSFGLSYQKQGKSNFRTLGEIERQWYGANLELFIEKRLGDNIVLRLTGNNLLDAASRQSELGFDGDSGDEIAANQRANNVDAFEVEHEESSPRILFTVRAVF